MSQNTNTDASPGPLRSMWEGERTAYVLLTIGPALFASNMLMARWTADTFPPVALAFWRWTVTLAILALFVGPRLWVRRHAIRREWRDLLVLGALGMGACGAFVYIGADTTTATNIGLIYAASPVLIILIARFFYGEAMSLGQGLGVALSLAGVLVIVCRGDLSVLLGLRFTAGDLWIVAAMAAWAVYAILLKYRPSEMGAMTRFGAIVLFGVLVLLPFHAWEALSGDVPELTLQTAGIVLFLALVPSFGAYQVYGRIQECLGAARTSLLMYLIPLYNSVLAFVLLGERFETYHLAGAALVLPGIYLATRRP